ncbi:MAG: hypothetical protein WEB50_07455 [Vicinamibacterales bacterium]
MRGADLARVTATAAVLTILMGLPVLRAPSERIFGMESVGRHHDPFTVMQQFDQPLHLGVYAQPVTDVAGAALARLVGSVAAYNWLVLLSFPLAAAAAYLLGRELRLSPAGAAFAALVYAFAPFHIAQAAYHPHIAQTQWLPLFLLALWRSLDRGTAGAAALLGAATLAVALSNFYGGLIAAVITPAAVAAYWIVVGRHARSGRPLAVTLGTLALLAAAGAAYAWWAAAPVVLNRAAFAFPRDDLFLYSARWWSYLVPPLAHPLAGSLTSSFWAGLGVRDGLLEQQVSVGWGVMVLAALAVLVSTRRGWQTLSQSRIPILVVVGAVALACSLSPQRFILETTIVGPSAALYEALPMFRSYARFGIVVQLMAALLGGIGVDWLLRAGSRGARTACAALVAVVALEYAVWPPALWRDVLPTSAHRWAVQQPGTVRILDCIPDTPESATVEWLTRGRVRALRAPLSDCAEPNLPAKLEANGYTHLLVRGRPVGARAPGLQTAGGGLLLASSHRDAAVFEVTAPRPAVYTSAMSGLSPREHNAEWSWRWCGDGAMWTVVNTGADEVEAALDLELAAFSWTRRVEVLLDGRSMQMLSVGPARRMHRVAPLRLSPGEHQLEFRPVAPATPAADLGISGDPRALSFALGAWTWRTAGGLR